MRSLLRSRHLPLLIVLLLLVLIYLSTLQTIPNGSDHYFMIDVGETQIVLNVWGSLHFTGYPQYVISGNLLVALLRLLGIKAVTAPAVVSFVWGLLALITLYILSTRLTRQPLAAALLVLLFGLTRTVWIHHNIAEIYTFGLLLVIILYALALWPSPLPLSTASDELAASPNQPFSFAQRIWSGPYGRLRTGWGVRFLDGGIIYYLAFIGGIAVAHHRAVVTLIPALLFAVWPELTSNLRRLPRQVIISLLLGLIGFIPYIYLPLRANAGAIWVYGEPGTLPGLWTQFMGAEGVRFVGLPQSWAALLANVQLVNGVLLTDLTAPGIVLGLLGLLLATRSARHRTAAITFILGGLGAYLFHALLYSDVLSALILQVTLSIAVGWLFLMDWLLVNAVQRADTAAPSPMDQNHPVKSPLYVWRGDLGVRFQTLRTARILITLVATLMALLLWAQNYPFIRALTTDPAGLETIALLPDVPPNSTLMLPWGTRHFAVGLARDVWGQRPDITLVDHKADFRSATEPLVTPDYVFYNYPVDWWQTQLNVPVYLRAAGPNLVAIAREPRVTNHDLPELINVLDAKITCTSDHITLNVDWAANTPPDADYSVYVHLLDDASNLVAQADQNAPVYGWRPLTSWLANEAIHDVYRLPRVTDIGSIRYGLYRQLPDGTFQNDYEYELSVNC